MCDETLISRSNIKLKPSSFTSSRFSLWISLVYVL